ncbi:hypothetical protein CUL92_18585 [Salmonella enterica subsp. enterica serovar Telelkebir]|nr:hypothetical protein [Salmonella enterica subsp. enterica serovar Telelkebir]ECU9605504.1 hypothetical protein [Salmonella enterica subsp. enterica serovar Telelkebir]
MKLSASSAICLTSLLLPLSAFAGEARFCESTNIKFTGNDKNYLTNEVVFDCGDNVKGTVIELSKAGWNITQVIETGRVDSFILLIDK